MLRFALSRTGIALAQVAAVAVGVFALTTLLPGDTAEVVLGEDAGADQVAGLRAVLGLDRPLGERFASWVGGALRGDLGNSLLTGVPVADELGRRFAITGVLALVSLAVLVPLALGLGVVGGLREGTRLDRAITAVTVFLQAVPEFALALLLVAGLSLQAGWFPATAAGMPSWLVLAEPAMLALPVTVLVCKQLCGLVRQVRAGVAQAHQAPYARHVRVLGLPEHAVLLRHVLPGAAGPPVQQLARTIDGLLGGIVVVEAVFSLSGVGSGFVEAVRARDLPLVQGYALLFATTAIVVNLCADLVAHRLVPQREGVA